ncbi:MAG TPA: tRNA preQ1(34) S-adenosylmethionine ribosyltransferase-isomerase QueA [Beijerinckiaceae bacterium]|nr:tRNA preQ1(34) S-adenosylmethionine ribosyltransferase-isomerase QueA [Beijerinckiaceae bacterium]
MRLSDFDFHLPPERIALHPARPRDAARMLVVRPDHVPEFQDRIVSDLTGFLRPGDALVFNDTRVIPARLFGRRDRDGASVSVEALLHRRLDASRWLAFARPGKRLRVGDRVSFGDADGNACLLGALHGTVEEKHEGGEVAIAFDLSGPALDDAIAAAGEMPLPPYIASARPAGIQDRTDYQTIYAREAGAVAAPTAGLHFTQDLFARLDAMGVSRHFVTLHVGAGTFLPVKAETLVEHKMHAEFGSVSAACSTMLGEVRSKGGRIVAVGTTTLRLLESAAAETGTIRPFAGETDIFIKPGFAFRAVDLLLTNFHLPKSTLFVLVSAFAGQERMRRAYAHAIAGGYRFYSYGDACLLERAGG